MKGKGLGTIAIVTALVGALGGSALSAQDKYSVKVPGGLAFSEFRGYEAWQVVSVSQDGGLLAAILANPDDDRRSEEHTSELQSLAYLVCRLLLEKKKQTKRSYLCRKLQTRA